MISSGTYTAKAVQWDFGWTKGSHDKPPSEQIAVLFEVTEGPFAGWTISWFGYFTDKTQQRTIESLRYCGWKNDDIMNMEGMGDLLVQIVVEEEVQQEGKNAGKSFPKVRWVNRLGGGGVKLEKPMDMQQKRMFAARMKMLAKTVPAVKGGVAANDRAPTEKPDEAKDNVPF